MPANAVASSSAPCVIAGAGKADADLVSAEDGVLAFGRGVFPVEDLAFPAAVLRGVGADIVEERIAAEDTALVEQHHAGQAALDAVEHPDVDGIEAVDDAVVAEPAGDRDRLLLDRAS